jgi:hypothetical protein
MSFAYRRIRRAYKYRLEADVEFPALAEVVPLEGVETDYASLKDGVLKVFADYAWDGVSGARDKPAMGPSLAHDVLYQLIRERRLRPTRARRRAADQMFFGMLRAGGMVGKWRAWLWWKALRVAGARAVRPRDDASELLTAP